MGGMDKQSESGTLDAIREQTSKIEDFLDTLSDPVKPYVHVPSQDPAEDSLRGPILCLSLLAFFNLLISNFYTSTDICQPSDDS